MVISRFISQLVSAAWAMLPAYVPNNAAVLSGGGDPIDGGRMWGDRRLLGDGKTWRGTAVGSVVGVLLAVVLNLVRDRVEARLGVSLPEFSLGGAVGLAVGAMLGDIAASFLKRRSGRERGASFPLLDQLDFVVGALGLAKLLSPVWFSRTFTPLRLVVVVVITPVLHLVTNGIAYLLGLKDEPY
ncbi:CDP-2,3-bis-(O-geranylgeranyl)-sn-glycerol synthase [Haloprofundus halobius]|uniref:CDP-2,3-bis-(O-geranylgeranyl)-sn-glycerol synthase n=1 Tax=Haloprofundus halobius TaxID=2876194 RepID=UPI001CCA8C54|nr:CDP-2,3-bis-(O-geranylgeranyl)-sn-glycerol synthase [Haloprofundus halobius]